jgi:hypothetical protein
VSAVHRWRGVAVGALPAVWCRLDLDLECGGQVRGVAALVKRCLVPPPWFCGAALLWLWRE